MQQLDIASFTTIADIICARAAVSPSFPVYSFESERDGNRTLTFAEVESQAKSIAVLLRNRGITSAVLLLYPPNSIEFIIGFYGCIFAGIPAIPAASSKGRRDIERICWLIRDSTANAILGDLHLCREIGYSIDQMLGMTLPWIDVHEIPQSTAAPPWLRPSMDRECIAHLQYTSGSVARPKGIAISHQNILNNVKNIDLDFEHDKDSIAVSWLPHFHDMGLVYGILAPALLGFRVVLLKPGEFARSPFVWLQAISKYRATHSGGPNFAYQLCADRLSAKDLASLDLRSWRIAFVGAEMVRPRTLDSFASACAPCGFDYRSFYPAYGLAEATLKVSGRRCDKAGPVKMFSRKSLSLGVADVLEDGATDAMALVSCGTASGDTSFEIVDSEVGEKLSPNRIGEIWVSGPSVASGYWRNPAATESVFFSKLRNDPRVFVRTGDLGFLHDTELFVVGRRKEILVIRGVKFSPDDLEASMMAGHSGLGGQRGVAFSVDDGLNERVVLIQEVDRSKRMEQLAEFAQGIYEQVLQDCGLQADVIAFVRRGNVPRTTSGKIQRRLCRQRYLTSQLSLLGSFFPKERMPFLPVSNEVGESAPKGHLIERIQTQLANDLAKIRPSAEGQPVGMRIAYDSLDALQLQSAIASRFNVEVPFVDLLAIRSIGDLAFQVSEMMGVSSKAQYSGAEEQSSGESQIASSDEARLWTLEQINQNSPNYRIAFGISIQGPLDIERLRHAIRSIYHSHPSLTAAYKLDGRKLIKQKDVRTSVTLEVLDETESDPERRSLRLNEIGYELCRVPLSLETGELAASVLIRYSDYDYCLVTAIHHIATDAASTEIFFKQVVLNYAPAPAETASVHDSSLHSDRVDPWRRNRPATLDASDVAFWKKFLSGCDGAVSLLPLRSAKPAHDSRASTMILRFDKDETQELRRLGNDHDATLYTVLLAGFLRAMNLWAHMRSITLVTPVSGRKRSSDWHCIGLFAHPMVLRFDTIDEPNYLTLLHVVKDVVEEALSHASAPFSEIVKLIAPNGRVHKLPFMDVMFNYVRLQTEFIVASDIHWRLLPLQTGTVENLINLTVIESSNADLKAIFTYPTECFPDSAISELRRYYREVMVSRT